MPLPAVTKRRDLIRKFRKLGFKGPFPGSEHPFMRRGKLRVPITNEHAGEKSDPKRPLLRKILKIAGISEKEWIDACS